MTLHVLTTLYFAVFDANITIIEKYMFRIEVKEHYNTYFIDLLKKTYAKVYFTYKYINR